MPPKPPAPVVDRSSFKETIDRKVYEWIEIPTGKFVTGISAEQVRAFQERIRRERHYEHLTSKEQSLLESAIAKAWAWKEKREELTREEQEVVRSDFDPRVPAGPGWLIYAVEVILSDIPSLKEHTLDVFYITRYPVTEHQMHPFEQSRRNFKMGESTHELFRPAIVYWRKDVESFCAWAGARLPSPREWEKAGRGPDGFLYPWGNEWDPRRCNFVDADGFLGYPPPTFRTSNGATKVNAYPKGASPYGVRDMAGNLREFTSQQGIAKGYNGRYANQEFLWVEHLLARETSDSTGGPKDPLCFRLVLDHRERQHWPGFRAWRR